MNTFLPEEYKVPQAEGNYMKLQEGENTIRIMSSAIIGWEYWTKENKPVRARDKWEEMPTDIKIGKDGKATIKHFWAFVVWNYNTKKIQILELTQVSIMGAIKALVDNKKWGDPKGYDITITRTGEGMETEYQTMPNPHEDAPEEAQIKYSAKVIDLEALYDNGDPFGNPL